MKWQIKIILVSLLVGAAVANPNALTASKAYDVSPVEAKTQPPAVVLSSTTIREYVLSKAKEYGVDLKIADWIVSHESNYDLTAKGDDGQSVGLWQISKIWHPEISNKCSTSLECSTDWSLKWIRAGHVKEWSTFRLCKKLYKDCPF